MNVTETFISAVHAGASPGKVLYTCAKGPRGLITQAHRDTASAARACLDADRQGYDAYFTPHRFERESYTETVDGVAKKRTRTLENMSESSSVDGDMDAGPGKPYPNADEAESALLRACDAAELPYPNKIVQSGNGIHYHWTFAVAIPKKQWLPLAKMTGQVLTAHGAKLDPSITSNGAAILRPPGTHNRKDPANPKPVTVRRETEGYTDPDDFIDRLAAARKKARVAHGGEGQASKPPSTPNKPALASKGPTPEVLDKIEAATRAKVGNAIWECALEKPRAVFGGQFGGEEVWFADQSVGDHYLACEIMRQARALGYGPDHMLDIYLAVFARSPRAQRVKDGRVKWDRADIRESGGRKAMEAVLAEEAKGQPRQTETGNPATGADPGDWPDPDEIRFELPPVPPFDPEVMLPANLAGYVVDQAELMQSPPEALAVMTITGMGAALGNKVGVMPKKWDTGWVEAPNTWCFTCQPPGSKKTPAQQRALAPLRPLEGTLTDRHQTRLAEFEYQTIQYQTAKKLWEKGVREGTATLADKPVEPVAPTEERLTVQDSTMAKLEEQLAASPHGLLLERDELPGLWNTLDHPNAGGDKEKYLTLWGGLASLRTDRIGRGQTVVPRATLSMVGGVQPGKLARAVRAAIKGGSGADGWIQRYSLAVYPDHSKTYTHVDRLPDFEAQEAAFETARRLFELDPTAIGAKPMMGSTLHCLQFTSEAQDVFDQWIVKLETLLRSGDLHPALESHFAKYRGLIPKLALIFHLVEDGAGPITLDALALAITWGKFLRAHARRIYAGALQGAELATKSLADRIRAGKLPNPFKARDVLQKGWAGLTEREDVEPAIDHLLDAGWLREERVHGTGRPTVRYWINPKIGQKKS